MIVCGGRDYHNPGTIRAELAALPAGSTVVHGGARGADTEAAIIAAALGLVVEPWPADWQRYGRSAGPRRNGAMLAGGTDLVLAFPGGAGTADMVARARRTGVPVRLVGSPVVAPVAARLAEELIIRARRPRTERGR